MQKQLDEKIEEMKKEIDEKKSDGFLSPENLKKIMKMSRYTFIVFILVMFFNVTKVDSFLRFKQFSIFYDIQNEQSTFLFVVIKSLLVSIFYYMITSLIK